MSRTRVGLAIAALVAGQAILLGWRPPPRVGSPWRLFLTEAPETFVRIDTRALRRHAGWRAWLAEPTTGELFEVLGIALPSALVAEDGGPSFLLRMAHEIAIATRDGEWYLAIPTFHGDLPPLDHLTFVERRGERNVITPERGEDVYLNPQATFLLATTDADWSPAACSHRNVSDTDEPRLARRPTTVLAGWTDSEAVERLALVLRVAGAADGSALPPIDRARIVFHLTWHDARRATFGLRVCAARDTERGSNASASLAPLWEWLHARLGTAPDRDGHRLHLGGDALRARLAAARDAWVENELERLRPLWWRELHVGRIADELAPPRGPERVALEPLDAALARRVDEERARHELLWDERWRPLDAVDEVLARFDPLAFPPALDVEIRLRLPKRAGTP